MVKNTTYALTLIQTTQILTDTKRQLTKFFSQLFSPELQRLCTFIVILAPCSIAINISAKRQQNTNTINTTKVNKAKKSDSMNLNLQMISSSTWQSLGRPSWNFQQLHQLHNVKQPEKHVRDFVQN